MHSVKALPSVSILLSTYNGILFIEEQINSLLAQDYRSIKIRVRDDGSTDGTLEFLRVLAQRDDRISVTSGVNLGCVKSFLELLRTDDADILMFCDQDDVWLPSKVSSAVSALVAAGMHRELLYHTDLIVVDDQLQTLASSFMAHQGLQMPRAHSLEVLAIQNCVVGCTVAMTAALVRSANLLSDVDGAAAMHDWWLALHASCRGGLIYSPRAEILYRQHGGNVSGVRRRSLLERIRLQFSSSGLARIQSYRLKVSRQAEKFLIHYYNELDDDQRHLFVRVAELDPDKGPLPVFRAQVGGLRFQNAYMNFAFLYSAAMAKIIRFFRIRSL
jgi:glycosyltransferase involved in cell wall biosynthesis